MVVLQNNSIYCCVRGALWSHRDLEPSWKSVPVNERLNPVLLSLCEQLLKTCLEIKPLPAGLKTAQSLLFHSISSHQCCTHHLIIAHSQPAEFHAQLGSASCQVLATSQLKKVVYFNNQPGKFSSRRVWNSSQCQLYARCYFEQVNK